MPGFVREHGEGDSFFRLSGKSELVGETQANFQWPQAFGEHGHKRFIFRSAAGDNYFAKRSASAGFRNYETLDGIGDGVRG